MPNDRDDFDGIDISGPWGGVRIGSGMRRGWEEYDSDGDAEYRRIRRKVRARLDFFKNVALFVFIVGGLALIDWMWGDGWWVQWVAVIWGALLALQFFSTFVSPNIWGKDVEERMVHREMQRRRGTASVLPDDEPPIPPA
jgi:NhaP-type Na+/H+ or K+/H+ antiporter